MKNLSDRYMKVFTYKGIDICVLKSASPSLGDLMGYQIDDARFSGVAYDRLGDALDAIDREEENDDEQT